MRKNVITLLFIFALALGTTLAPANAQILVPQLSTVPLTVTLSVESSDMDGNTFAGQWVELWQDGEIVQEDFTPFSADVESESEYQVFIYDDPDESKFFDHWEDGSTNPTRTFALTEDAAFTAFFQTDATPQDNSLVANDDSATTDEDTPVTIDVMANDNLSGTGLFSVSSVTLPSNGVATINDDSTITYMPDRDFFDSDSFQYTISDSTGLIQDGATVFVTINPVNDPPVATDDDITTDEDTPVSFFAEENDFDVDGDEIFVLSVEQGANGTAEIASDGAVAYTPNLNFNGNDSFTYVVSDMSGANDTGTVFVTINPVNDAPTAVDDTASTLMNEPVTIDVLSNDSDTDGDSLNITSASTPSNGTPTINANNTITYSPDQDFAGNDLFTYTISDGKGGTDSATVSVTVSRTLATISVNINNPSAVDVNPNTNTIYVRGANGISIIDGTTDTIAETIVAGFRSGSISVNDATNMVYAKFDRAIVVINGTDNTIIDSFGVADQAFISTIDVNPETNMVYVGLDGGFEPHKVIDGNTNEIVDTIPSTGFANVAVNPVTNLIYFVEGGTVAVVNGSTNTIVERIEGIPRGTVDVNSLTNMIYVADFGDVINPMPTNVTVIDGDTNTVVAKTAVGSLPSGITVNEITNIVYVTNNADETISVIDGQTNEVIATVPIGDGPGGNRDSPSGITVNEETNKVYVANREANTVTVVQGFER